MAITRKMLSAMGIESEKIDQIIEEHSKTVNEVKEERDDLKAKLKDRGNVNEELENVKSELKEAKAKLDEMNGFEKKYTDLKEEFDKYKSDIKSNELHGQKVEAYKKLLNDAGISEKRISSIMKVSNVDDIKLDENGKIKDIEKLTEDIKTEWSDFIVTKSEQGANVADPPSNEGNGGKQLSRAAQLTAQYRNEHYGNPKEV